jgi:hypothetical protein
MYQMKPFYTLLLLFALPLLSPAQDLAVNNFPATGPTVPTMVSVISQQWVKEADQVKGSIGRSQLAKMKTVTTALVSFLKNSCFSSDSYSPLWHGEYFSARSSAAPLAVFGVDCRFAPDQKAELTITANDIAPLLGHLEMGGHHFLTMDMTAAAKNGALYFEQNGTQEDGSTKVRRWLITTGNDRLPYTPVTRKEYLQEARTEVTAIKNSIVADWKQRMPIRSAAIQEAEKKATIDQLNAQYSGVELQMRVRQFLHNYKTDEQYLRENTDKQTASLDATLHLMDDLLSHSTPAELGKPAMVSVPAADFNGFEDGRTDRMLVRINTTYFNTATAEEKPQVFLVEWRYDAADAGAAEMDRQLMEKFDGAALKALLGK